MDFSEGQEAIIEKIVYKVGDVLMNRFDKIMDGKITMHTFTCPAGAEVSKYRSQLKSLLIGIAIGGALVGGGGVLGIMKLLRWI
ncbi:MAG: hypothetical protein ABIG61_17765 [Planctomycetota bacterium]